MELTTATLSDLTKNAKVLFLKGLDSVMPAAQSSGLFRMEPIADNTGDTREYTEIDLEEYASLKPEGDQSSRASVQQGYSKTAKLKRISKDIGITYEMRHYNKYSEVVSRLTNLGRLASNRIELDLQHRITFGTATSYTDKDGESVNIAVGDTLALFSTVHTVRGSATTFRNRLANNPVFSKGALESMEQMIIENSINQLGEKITISYDVIYSTDDPNTVNTIREHLKSTAAPAANNNGVINVFQGKYRHVVLPLIATTAAGSVDSTKAKYWGLASTINSQAYLAMNEAPRMKTPPADGKSNEDFSTDNWDYGVRAGYFIVIPGARWISLSTGDATA